VWADELEVARWTLSTDFVYRKIPPELHEVFLMYGINFGKGIAHAVKKKFGTSNPESIAKKLCVQVKRVPVERKIAGIQVRSEYYSDTFTIYLYEVSISEFKNMVRHYKLEELIPLESIDFICIAHELFHHIEVTETGLVSKKVKVTTCKIGPFHLRSGVPTLSEIAADSFVKTLLNLKCSPSLVDYVVSNSMS
jgi:hypothetical protein